MRASLTAVCSQRRKTETRRALVIEFASPFPYCNKVLMKSQSAKFNITPSLSLVSMYLCF